jgi:hypothetical protein
MTDFIAQPQYQIKLSNWPCSARPATFSVRRKLVYFGIKGFENILQCSFFSQFCNP